MAENTPKKDNKSGKDHALNHDLLHAFLRINEDDLAQNKKLTDLLISGEKSPLIAHFNPKNHLAQLHSTHE